MKRVCKYCGAAYEGDPGSSACPACVAAQKATSIRPRVCRACGATFPGGPRAWYCPDCRSQRRKEAAARYRRKGPARPIGSLDNCEVCGKEYIVNAARQRYCPQCAPERYREIDREQSKVWNATNTTPEERRKTRQAAGAPISCKICGKQFVPKAPSLTCSPECSQELLKKRLAAWENANRDARNAYQRERLHKKEAAMSPEEYRAYREKINSRARENARKRKEKKQ